MLNATIPTPTLPLVSFCGRLSRLHSLSLISFHDEVQCHSWQVESSYTISSVSVLNCCVNTLPLLVAVAKLNLIAGKLKACSVLPPKHTLHLINFLWGRCCHSCTAQLILEHVTWLKALGLLKPGPSSVRDHDCFQDYRHQKSKISCVPLKPCSDWKPHAGGWHDYATIIQIGPAT